MAGIYLHIPFCRQACSYCDFHFSTNRKRQGDVVYALVQEIKARSDFFVAGTAIETVYFGGGTPSLLTESELGIIFSQLHQHFEIHKEAEITLEANPDDLEIPLLRALQRQGVNRLSIGIQSFRDADLKLLNRSHDAHRALQCVRAAQDSGIENISVDLIYGIPGCSPADWTANLDQVLALKVPHISAYGLTVEEKTLLDHQVRKGAVQLPDDAAYEGQYFQLIDRLQVAGYRHYEISNFALAGRESRHNTSYWKGLPYLGLGPSAHSFDGRTRSWNVANNAQYLRRITAGESPVAQAETLSPREQLNEMLMVQLRLGEGLDLQVLKDRFDFDLLAVEEAAIHRYLDAAYMEQVAGRLRLTPRGQMVSDSIISELFQVADEAHEN